MKSAVVRNTLPTAVSGTADFTSTGFGTVAAAIIISGLANTTNNPQDDAGISITFWDGTTTQSVSIFSLDANSTAQTQRTSDSGAHKELVDNTGTANEYTISSTTNGITLTMSVDNTTLANYCTVLLLGDVDAKVMTVSAHATQNSATTSASVGFEPKLLIGTCVGHTGTDTDKAQGKISIGVCRDSDLLQRSFTILDRDNRFTTECYSQFSESYVAQSKWTGGNLWSGEITAMGADTFDMTTREGSGAGDVYFLVLGGANLEFDIGTLTMPITATTDATTTTVEPETLFLLSSNATDTTHQSSGWPVDCMCLGMSNATNDYLHQIGVADGLGTSDTRSIASAAAIIDCDEESSGWGAASDATVDSFNATDFTLDYSAVPGTARKGIWLVFGKEAAAASPPQMTLLGVG